MSYVITQALSAFTDGSLTWENVNEIPLRPRHVERVSRARMVQLARAVASGDLASLEQQDWLPGYLAEPEGRGAV